MFFFHIKIYFAKYTLYFLKSKIKDFHWNILFTTIILLSLKETINYLILFYGLEVYDYGLWNSILIALNDYIIYLIYLIILYTIFYNRQFLGS